MRIGFEPPPILFVHIPKTGGIAFARVLRLAYKGRDRIDLAPRKLAQLTRADLARFRYYHSWHQGPGMLDLIGRHDLACLTLLREPVERVVSEIHFHLRDIATYPQRFTPEYQECARPFLQADLRTCLNHELIGRRASNYQTYFLGTVFDCTPFLKGSEDAASGRTGLFPYPLPAHTNSETGERLLENAGRWLSEMAMVGLTERHAESVALACDLLGIPTPVELPRENMNPQRTSLAAHYRDQLPPDVVAQLEDMNRCDLVLYAYACDLFEQQWARYRAQPRRTVSLAPRLRRTGASLKATVQQALGRTT